MEEWKEYKLGEVCTISSSKRIFASEYQKNGIPFYRGKEIIEKQNGRKISNELFISEERYNEIKCKYGAPKEGDMLLSSVGTLGVPYIIQDETFYFKDGNLTWFYEYKGINNYFLYYWFLSPEARFLVDTKAIGSTQKALTIDTLKKFDIFLPPIDIQDKIVSILKSLDDKIEMNRRINDNFYFAFFEVMLIWLLTSLRNDNLEQQAMALFDMMFPAVASGEDIIGNVIIPKRGKGLLSKDAVEGNVPVVAGGLEPATYHNESNTVAPVVTISASGANAGFVNLWQIPVWSSDSSFIDASMTENVYFWYVMLKKRQKEIFDAQTGSAQPHIYPKHIAEMPMGNFEHSDVEKFTEIVTPMFEIRGRNLKESERLASIRDTLLPKLMSGELKLNEVNV